MGTYSLRSKEYKEKCRANSKAYYEKNREKVLARMKEKYQKNKKKYKLNKSFRKDNEPGHLSRATWQEVEDGISKTSHR